MSAAAQAPESAVAGLAQLRCSHDRASSSWSQHLGWWHVERWRRLARAATTVLAATTPTGEGTLAPAPDRGAEPHGHADRRARGAEPDGHADHDPAAGADLRAHDRSAAPPASGQAPPVTPPPRRVTGRAHENTGVGRDGPRGRRVGCE